jgi:hypothetical protein
MSYVLYPFVTCLLTPSYMEVLLCVDVSISFHYYKKGTGT